MIEVVIYEDLAGDRPFQIWLECLPVEYAAKVDTAIVRLAGGNRSGLKSVGGGVSEWRVDWGPGLRIYLGFDGSRLVILLGGGTKKRQGSDITAAKQVWAEYKRRKRKGDVDVGSHT